MQIIATVLISNRNGGKYIAAEATPNRWYNIDIMECQMPHPYVVVTSEDWICMEGLMTSRPPTPAERGNRIDVELWHVNM